MLLSQLGIALLLKEAYQNFNLLPLPQKYKVFTPSLYRYFEEFLLLRDSAQIQTNQSLLFYQKD
ncbi:hypothetical protein K170097C1_34390 [Hungatella effluvii]